MWGLQHAIGWVERGLVPDWITRKGIRRLLEMRLKEEDSGSKEANQLKMTRFVDELRNSPVALHTESANEQHYEVPASFFEKVLGKRFKYSCAYFPEGLEDLDLAEEEMLSLYGKRGELQDGQSILELGCGWGSLTVWMAENFPNSKILAMSNSASQKTHIEKTLERRGLKNVTLVTADINQFQTDLVFDRVVSIEMFEHVRNYQTLFRKISGWLKSEGKLFTHIFCHREFAYPYETEGADNWMGRYFFTGGIMPSEDLFLNFQEDLSLEKKWRVNGTHYQKTSRAWLENMDRNQKEIWPILEDVYGSQNARKWWVRWRLFFMSCEELFGFRNGYEWMVAHYLFRKAGK